MKRTLSILSTVLALAGSIWIAPVITAAAPGARTDYWSAKEATAGRSVGRVLSDVTITGKVKSALIGDKKVSASEINVDTVKGVVHLRGKVDSKAEAKRAIALTRRVEGVKGVKSHLEIVPNEKTAGYREQHRAGSGRKMNRK